MLKKMRLGGIVLASLLAVTGCQNEEIVSNKQQKGNYSLKVSSLVDSRTYVENDGTVKWSKDDKLYVYGEGVSGVLTLQGNGGGTTGTFSGFVFGDPDDLKWAVFGDEVKGTADGAQFTISSITDPNSNSPMVGEIIDGDVQMNHLCGMVRITINNLPEGADVELTGTGIAGTAEVKDGVLNTTDATFRDKIDINVAAGNQTIEVPVFVVLGADETPDDEGNVTRNFTLKVDEANSNISVPVAVGKLSQEAIMELTCVVTDGKVTGFAQAAASGEQLAQALKNGGSITLTDDIEITKSLEIPEGVTINLDLAGKSITAGSDGYVIKNSNGGTLKITDETNEGAITGVVYTGTNSTTTIEGGTYNAVEGGNYVLLNSGGTLTINQAIINGGSSYPIYSYDAGHKLVINDATVNATFGCVNAYGINGIVEINGGTYTMTGVQGKTSHIVYCSNGDFTINGGNFNKEGDINMSGTGGGGVCAIYGAKLTINGGNFAGDYADVYNWDGTNSDGRSVSIEIKGGSFKFNPNSMVAEGYKATEVNGKWAVTESDVAIVTNVQEFNTAITNSVTKIQMYAGTYTASQINADGKTLILTGAEDGVIIDINQTNNVALGTFDGSNVTFENMTLKTRGGNYKGFARMQGTYNNCTFENLYFPQYGEHEFNGCTFDAGKDEHCIWTYGASKVTFDSCDFNYTDRCVNVYLDNGKGSVEVDFSDCKFITSNTGSVGSVEINSSAFPQGVSVDFTDNCTAPAYGEMVFISKYDNTKGKTATVTVNGAEISTPIQQ